jgi:integrase
MTAAYTGARREEIALLRVSDLEGDVLRIREGKTAAAVRSVPAHPALLPVLKRLAKTSSDGYLLPGLITGGEDAKRGHMIGKRFSYLIRKAGFSDTALTFHTLRNAFMQRCEEAGVPESTAKLIVGHSRQSLTYGTAGNGYSPGVGVDTLRREVAKVTFGAVDAYVQGIAGTVAVTLKARRRHRRERT